MKILASVALLTACAFFGNSAFAQEGDAFTKANEEFAAGRFREAIELYDGGVGSGQFSAALFYNLGNAWYRAGDPGRAILNYERALTIEPRLPEAQANLRLVRDKARALELPKTSFERLLTNVTHTNSTLASAISFWVFAFTCAALLLRRRRSAKLVVLLAVSALLCISAWAALHVLENGNRGRALAIVTGSKIEARVATADNAGSVLPLPPGTEIKVLSTRGEWLYAALPNNLRGWVPAQSAERVRL